MIDHQVRSHPSSEHLPTEDQLAWKLATVATDSPEPSAEVVDMVINRLIDNAAVAAAALHRDPIRAARDQALRRRGTPGATVFGLPADVRVQPEWAAWVNAAAVRELDFHDTFVAAEAAHPADNIPALIAVAQHAGRTGTDLVRGIVAAYEIQVDLCKGISLHKHKIDQIAHLGPSAAAGLGAMLGLPPRVIAQAIGQALHCTTTTFQARTGEISTWKAFAPAFAGKVAIEAVDGAMRGLTAPAPIYEGQNGVIAWLLGGPDAVYSVPLPEPGEPRVAILETYTKEHAAEYFSQAYIDLAIKVGPRIPDWGAVTSIVIHGNANTHNFIGSGAGDPKKYDPNASRETLDHSLPFIFAVALQDGGWDEDRSYTRERRTRPDTVALWQKIRTVEDPEWTRRFNESTAVKKAFGGRVEITLDDGTVVSEEIAVADAHPMGARPFARDQYVAKFAALADGVIAPEEQERFLATVTRLPDLTPEEVAGLALPSLDPYAGQGTSGIL